jgi:hypothetical protein
VKVNSYEGTCSRSSLDSGAVVDVLGCFGAAAVDSERIADSTRDRDRACACAGASAGRVAGDVCSVWRSRFADAGMCSAGEALRV